MAKLDANEEKLLKKLLAKKDAPDAPSAAKSLNISIDLGDEAQVERAQRLGLLEMFSSDNGDDDEGDDDDEGGDDDEEEAPRRRGYFKD